MGQNSAIEWTDATWNPVRGCSRVSDGCRHCYAEMVAARFSGAGQPYEGLAEFRVIGAGTPKERREAHWTGQVRLVPEHLEDPLRWKRPRRIFVNSMSDLFHESLTNGEIARVFAVICQTLHDRPRERRHTYQILTKRAERMAEWFDWAQRERAGWFNGAGMLDLGDVQIGGSVENQPAADERIPHLLRCPAKVRFLSCEPLLGLVNVRSYLGVAHSDDVAGEVYGRDGYGPWVDGSDWVISGGESGAGARTRP